MSFGKKTNEENANTPEVKPQEIKKEVPAAPEVKAKPEAAPAPQRPNPEFKPQNPQQPGLSGARPQALSPDMKAQAEQQMARAKSMAKHATAFVRYLDPRLITEDFKKAKIEATEAFIDKMDLASIEKLPPEYKKERIERATANLISMVSVPLNLQQQELLKKEVADEILGFGPLEVLLNDQEVADIMVNTHSSVYIEKNGKLALTDITFTSEKHLLNVIQKIVSRVGRRVDETSPMVDARMPDGSRFNAIIPPVALEGSLISIRKFKQNKMPLKEYVTYQSMTDQMSQFLEICANIRLNIIISGGTGSGKTTLLNALSGHIDGGERIITIEDAAELQLHQPHVLRLESRPPNMEGVGEITQRMLVKNALRMRPDRIILGEIRGDEVIDVLAAMNTGHEGSMATIHSNSPRDCLARIENLVGMTGVSIPTAALRQQVSSAVHLIVQIARMRDGKRRITQIEEVVGLEGDVITTQAIFVYRIQSVDDKGNLIGEFVSTGTRPRFFEKAIYFDRDAELLDCLGIGSRKHA